MSTIKNEEYIIAFGANLRKIRQSKKLTCADLEELTSIDEKQIARLERGERGPNISTIYALAKGLGIQPYKLFQFEFKD